MANFTGIVYLTEEQYTTLKTNGTITVGETTLLFDENTLYVTPEAAGGGIDLSNYVTQENFDKLINNETIIQPNANSSIFLGTISSTSQNSVIIGKNASAKSGGHRAIAIGNGATSAGGGVAIGLNTNVSDSFGIAIGSGGIAGATVTGNDGIQLGEGTNSTSNSLQVYNDNIYNWGTHTLTVQNIALNGVDLQGTLTALEGQNEYIGRYEGNSYTADTIQTELSSFVSTTAGRAARNGDLVNIVNGIYAGQQWRFGGTLWIYYINFENHSVINNLNSTSTTDGLSAAQGKVLSDEILRLDGEVSGNTEDIAMLQGDMAGKTNVAFNNVHQDYVNFSSDPQTQINTLNTNINNKTIKLAWTNQNAGQAIGDTAISLGTVLFDYCIIECCVSTDKIHERVTQIFIPHLDNVYEEYCLMNCYDGRTNKSYSRQILKGNGENGSKGYLYFSKAFANGTQDNTKLVPYKVYIGRF